MTDEGGKINLNALLQLDSSGQVAHDMLMQLPNMTEDVANAILDWIDPDDDAAGQRRRERLLLRPESAATAARTARWTASRSCCWSTA